MLWKADRPLRLAQWVQVTKAGELVRRIEVREYACRGGTLRLTLASPVAQRIVLARFDRPLRVLRLRAQARWTGTIPALARGDQCNFEVVPEQSVVLEQVLFARSRA